MRFAIPKKISMKAVMRLLLLIVIIAELYLSYVYLFRNLSPQGHDASKNNIIRVNRSAFQDISLFLDGLDHFTLPPTTLTNINPFATQP